MAGSSAAILVLDDHDTFPELRESSTKSALSAELPGCDDYRLAVAYRLVSVV